MANQPLIESYTGKITEWVFRRYRSLTQHSRCLDLHLHTQDDTGDPSSQAANQHTFNDVLDDAIADDDNPSGRCAPADILLAPGESRSLQQVRINKAQTTCEITVRIVTAKKNSVVCDTHAAYHPEEACRLCVRAYHSSLRAGRMHSSTQFDAPAAVEADSCEPTCTSPVLWLHTAHAQVNKVSTYNIEGCPPGLSKGRSVSSEVA